MVTSTSKRLTACLMLCSFALAASEKTDDPAFTPPLGEADRIAITTLLVGRHPKMASSPGLKTSRYWEGGATDDCGMVETHTTRSDRKGVEITMEPRTNCDTDFATLYFLPHSERLGRGEAGRVNCKRPTIARVPAGAAAPEWTCHEVRFREYVQLEGQVCEVRLTGDMSTPALIAAREAGMEAIRTAGEPEPEALVLFTKFGKNGGSATFGTNDCRPGVSVEFSLSENGDPEDVASWEAKARIR